MDIKSKFVQGLILLMKSVLSLIYFFFKLIPVKEEKVLFCSRQSNKEPLDFLLIKNEIKKRASNVVFATVCSHLDNSVKGIVLFAVQILKSAYHLATSNICVVDSYWPAVSILKHKKNLKIIQIWHSIGKIKKSGFQSLDKKSGRKSNYAQILKMHNNYDYFIGGAPVWNRYYCEAFDITEDRILNYGLPRIDYLIDTEKENRRKFFEEFPQWKDKKIVLYAPTFRRNMKSKWNKIAEVKKYDDMLIIVKNHPGQSIGKVKENENILFINDWETIDLIAVCDYMITDYSSIALEAAVLKKKTLYWIYDYDEYMENSGTNINLKEELHDNVSEDINELIDSIENDKYNYELQERYIKKYLPENMGNSTEKIVSLILKLITEQQVNVYETCDNGGRSGKQMEKLFGNLQAFSEGEWRTTDMQNDKIAEYDGSKKLGNNSNVS